MYVAYIQIMIHTYVGETEGEREREREAVCSDQTQLGFERSKLWISGSFSAVVSEDSSYVLVIRR